MSVLTIDYPSSLLAVDLERIMQSRIIKMGNKIYQVRFLKSGQVEVTQKYSAVVKALRPLLRWFDFIKFTMESGVWNGPSHSLQIKACINIQLMNKFNAVTVYNKHDTL